MGGNFKPGGGVFPIWLSVLVCLLGGRFGYFLFFLLGGEEGGVRGARRGGGVSFGLKIPGGGGGGSFRRGGVPRGQEGVCRDVGGAKYFFWGRNSNPEGPAILFLRSVLKF